MNVPSTPLHSGPDEEVALPSESMPTNDIDLNPGLDESDTEFNTPEPRASEHRISAWTIPFEDALSSLKEEFNKSEGEPISHTQQSKFVSYTDREILHIQRKFIKFQANPENAYPLETVLAEVGHVMDFIWRSVNAKTALFGQEEYYLRILGDMEEWLEYYSFPAASHVTFYVQFFNFFQKIDTQVSFLVDGYETADNTLSKLSTTEKVRLSPLITRLRLLIISKIDKIREEGLSDIMDLEIGRLFEGLLERL